MQLALLIIVLIPIVIYLLNSKNKNTVIKKLGYVAIGVAVLYLIVIIIQPNEYIVYNNTTIEAKNNKK